MATPPHNTSTTGPVPNQAIYIVDRQLNLVEVNEQWADFARSNRGQMLLTERVPRNLLQSMSGSARARWESIYQLLLNGQLSSHEEQFNCSSPTERRTYRLRITPQVDASGTVQRLVHQTVPVDDDGAAKRRVEELAKLRDDPASIHRSYRTRVIERRIEIAAFDTSRHFRPLGQSGGDMLWHRGYADGRVDLVIADAMGHGESAGVLATQLSYLLDEVAKSDRQPMQIVAALSEASRPLIDQQGSGFATGLFLRFDSRGQRMTACNFGHDAPIFSHSGQIRMKHGPPVGLDPGLGDWSQITLDFAEHGRRFIIFTDGITEQFNIDGRMFTVAGLERVFRQNLDSPLPRMVEQVVKVVENFQGEAITKDDQTLLAIECRGGA
jgi:hypothetical protein